jgi:thioredoxin 1
LDLLIYTVVGLAVTWGFYSAYMYVATRAAEGRQADPLYALFPRLAEIEGKALVYCFSPGCGPCRPMSKEVDILAASGAPIFKLDISQHAGLSRELGIRAAPTLMVIENRVIGRMVLGVKTADHMQRLLQA